MTTAPLVVLLAEEFADADHTCRPIATLTDRHPDLDVVDAYAIQTADIDRRGAAGTPVRGRKVGLTSRAMQELRGVDEPDLGVLLDDMFVEDGDDVRVDTMLQPRVEAEMAFVMERDLAGPG